MNKPTFRAWDEHEEEMLENIIPLFDADRAMIAIITDFQIIGSPGTSEIEIGSYDTTLNWDEFPYILMQSTGLKDKNGVEIFEGDVVIGENFLFPFPDNRPLPIYWDEETGGFQLHAFNKKTIEIVGNIHENPELLNEVE